MINPIVVSPLNTTSKICYECKFCGEKGEFVLDSSICIDKNGKIAQEEIFECPKCNKRL